MRGRGRGGGGRGFGRSGPPGGPLIRDDDGSGEYCYIFATDADAHLTYRTILLVVLPSQPLGPPATYPEIELPDHTELSAKDMLLLVCSV